MGLEFVLTTYGKKKSELADAIGVPRPNVTGWLKEERLIPQNRLEQISQLFPNIPVEYFQKKLDRLEQLRVEYIHLNELSKNETDKYDSTFTDDDGEVHNITNTHDPYEHEIRMKIEEIEMEKLLQRLRGVLMDESFLSGFRQDKHFQLMNSILSLLELDSYSEDEHSQPNPSPISEKVSALIDMIRLLVDEKITGFGHEANSFIVKQAKLLQEEGIIKEANIDEATDDPFNKK